MQFNLTIKTESKKIQTYIPTKLRNFAQIPAGNDIKYAKNDCSSSFYSSSLSASRGWFTFAFSRSKHSPLNSVYSALYFAL